MRNNQPVTGHEQPVAPEARLISTTSRGGRITSANDDFVAVSGFRREELVGSPHNLVRHPDMPSAAFESLWRTIKAGRPWLGLVKNRCKNGDHYYVDAYVTPILEGDEVVGYQSVRVTPEPGVVERAEKIYARIRRGRSAVSRLVPCNWSLRGKAAALALLAALPALALGQWLAAAATAVLVLGAGLALVAPARALALRSRQVLEDSLAQQVLTGRADEVGQIDLAMRALQAHNRTVLGRIGEAAASLGGVAAETECIVRQTTDGVRRQQLEVDQVATAMNEMTATVQEVARNAEETARSSQDVLGQTAAGDRLVRRAMSDIESLSGAVADASRVIENLQAESQRIGSVVDVISNIASETNLLALNAAIEAARAGEQGRGFAVVADEVRNLASHTQKSTDEIQQMVKHIQQSSAQAVEVMRTGQQRADASVALSQEVGSAFGEISMAVDRITAMNAQVATASEEQNAVSEEINRNLVAISEVANTTLDSADQTASASRNLHVLVENLQTIVRQFGRS